MFSDDGVRERVGVKMKRVHPTRFYHSFCLMLKENHLGALAKRFSLRMEGNHICFAFFSQSNNGFVFSMI